MIYEANIHTRKKLVSMFEDFNNVVLLSYLQGHMGTAWVNDLENPTVAQVTVGILHFTLETQIRKKQKSYYVIFQKEF